MAGRQRIGIPRITKPNQKDMSDQKVSIELTPFQAIEILAFMREFVNDQNKEVPELAAIHEAVGAYEEEIYEKITDEMMEEVEAENEVNFLLGKQPPNRGGKPID